MALDFEVIDKGCTNFRKPYKIVSLPENFPDFFLHSELKFPMSASKLLYYLDPYGDTMLSHEELKCIQHLCHTIREMFMYVQDYSIYAILAGNIIKQKDLLKFADSLHSLISYAFEHDKAVWTVGD